MVPINDFSAGFDFEPSVRMRLTDTDPSGSGREMGLFSQDQLEAIAGALGDTDAGLTGPEIQHLIASAKMNDPGTMTKRTRIYNAFAESQNTKRNRTNISEFIRLAMKPARYSRAPERYEPMRTLLNQALAFAGSVVDQTGDLKTAKVAQTLPEAQRRA
ncbi:hypothetical protein OY671_009813, partial [Metschnikowia pulcherrima]